MTHHSRGLRSACAALLTVVLPLVVWGCYRPPPVPEVPSWIGRGAESGAPVEEEPGLVREADESVAQLAENDAFISIEELDAYLAATLARILPPIPATAPSFAPRVYAAAENNAFALSNGVLLLTAGLLVDLDNEAQLAFLLGHEVAHVLLRHRVVNERFRAHAASHVDRMWLSRHLEDEADELGFGLAVSAGYAPEEAARMLDHLRDEHPPGWARIAAWDSHAETPVRIRIMRWRAHSVEQQGSTGQERHRERFLEAQDLLRLRTASIVFGAGDAERALELVERHLERDPDSAAAHRLRAKITRRTHPDGRRAPSVRSDYERALELDPADADAHRSLGLLLRDLREPHSARVHLERYLELRPDAVDRRLIERYLGP